MGAWPTTYSEADFFQPTSPPVTVVKAGNGGLVYPPNSLGDTGWNRQATELANTPTGYFSDKYICNRTPLILPGDFISPLVWESRCQQGVYRELSLADLVLTIQAGDYYKDQICNSLTDRGGNPKLPLVCGGTDPDIDNYNPNVNAGEEVSSTIGALQTEAEQTAEEIILQTRKKIFGIGFIILLLVVIGYILIKQ